MIQVGVWSVRSAYNMTDLDVLPDLDSQRPMPPQNTVPPLFQERFAQYSAIANEHFSFNSFLKRKLWNEVFDLGLHKPREEPVVGYVLCSFFVSCWPTISECRLTFSFGSLPSVYFRGGDKLAVECHASAQMSWWVPFTLPIDTSRKTHSSDETAVATSRSTARRRMTRSRRSPTFTLPSTARPPKPASSS